MHKLSFSKTLHTSAIAVIASFGLSGVPFAGGKTNPPAADTAAEGPAVLWREPVDITSRNLYYGPGGKGHEPQGTFTFEKEDMAGSNPKFDVVDQDGVKWRVKLGDEARPETVASRLLWAVGYIANEDYFLPVVHIQNMPRLHRGMRWVAPDGAVSNVRLKRHLKEQKKTGLWTWAHDPFTGTREWNGLRVMMAIMNNWDLKDANNSVYSTKGDHPEELYVVSDLGASFGPPVINWTQRGKLKAYNDSKWITRKSREYVDFSAPAWPALNHWIGRHIPVADARWVAHWLVQLSPQQIGDAFRAAGYSPQEVEGFTSVVQRRIADLTKL